MTSIGNPLDRKPLSASRPTLSHFQADPSSPHTPQRGISSTFSSPSVSFRVEEESVVLELGTRHLTAGFAGEQYPRCRLSFGREESRRVGDYRIWLPGHDNGPKRKRRLDTWGDDSELWRMDLRGFDLGIVYDKIERLVREAYNKYLLLDSKARKMCLIVPSVLPQQLLDRILHTLFEHFQMPSVTLLSPAIMSTVAAGCRSALVVDMGWKETTVTAVYDYRELKHFRTIRGMRMVTSKMAQMLENEVRQKKEYLPNTPLSGADQEQEEVSIDLEQAEDATGRMAWCNPRHPHTAPDQSSSTTPTQPGSPETPTTPQPDSPALITMPHPQSPRSTLSIPFSSFSQPVESALLTPDKPRHEHDNHDQPLPALIYKALLSLPPDVRAVCMSRLIFVGGGSHIPGLKSRLVDEVKATVEERGFDGVEGRIVDEKRMKRWEARAKNSAEQQGNKADRDDDEKKAKKVPASEQPQTVDEIDVNLQKDREKYAKPNVSGVVRGVESLGAWAGGSLVASLRIRGIVDIERETFMQFGLAGGMRKEPEANLAGQRKSYAGDMRRGMADMRGSWTLGAWA